jgi:SAM-dependent MidA family methyltransferase
MTTWFFGVHDNLQEYWKRAQSTSRVLPSICSACLQEPGTADLSAWVDFDAICKAIMDRGQKVQIHGPLTQGQFLLANGIEKRVDFLQQVRSSRGNTPGEEASALNSRGQ